LGNHDKLEVVVSAYWCVAWATQQPPHVAPANKKPSTCKARDKCLHFVASFRTFIFAF
jgi:hypothetical protein